MQINVTYALDPKVAPPPEGFYTTVQYAVDILEAAFTNNVTMNIVVGWNLVEKYEVGPSEDGVNLYTPLTYSYSEIESALLAHATSPAQQAAYATLPSSDPTNGGLFELPSAEARALGLTIPANTPTTDAWVGVSSSVNWSYDPHEVPGPGQTDLVSLIEHEITEAMGRNSYLGTVSPDSQLSVFGIEDLFRYSASGVRQLTPGAPASTGYFSIDHGATNLGVWNNDPNAGDLGDWNTVPTYDGPGPHGQDSFDNNGAWHVYQPLTQNDLTLMQILGWDPSQPQNIVIKGETYYVPSGQVEHDPLLIMAGGTVDIADGGSVTGTITFHGEGGLLTIEGDTPPTNAIGGFKAGDTIDFKGAPIGAHPTVTLLADNVLQIVEHGHTYDFLFDRDQDFSGQNFEVVGDGSGGTEIFVEPSLITVGNPSPGSNPSSTSLTVTGPDITNGSGDINAGHVVTFTLNMNTDIVVDTTNGTPTLSLNDGEIATYSGGSGSQALTFTYTVASGDNTPALAITGVNLNGGTIQDVNGHDANLSGAVGPPQGNLQIDTTPPTLTGATLSGSNWVLSFSEPVMANPASQLALLDRPGAYDASATAALHDPTKAVFDFSSMNAVGPPAPGHELTGVTDLAGNAPVVDLAAAVHTSPAFAILLVFSEIAAEYGANHSPAEAAENSQLGAAFHLLA